ncbi:MAG: preprotein translocase subunit SecG [Bdellovibrionota bacterium]
MLTNLLTVLHVFVSLFLILVVLLQTGGADMGTAFGGSSSSVLGAAGGNKFMTRLTAVVATVFMITSISLTVVGTGTGGGSVLGDLPEEEPAAEKKAAPEQPTSPEGAAGATVTEEKKEGEAAPPADAAKSEPASEKKDAAAPAEEKKEEKKAP